LDYLNKNKDFFNSVSGFYDDMIGFNKSLKKRADVYKKILNTSIKTAADLGCGTGLDSIALDKNGIKVTAFDLSTEMINVALVNSIKHNCKINFVCSGIDKIPIKYNGKFDFAVSMGNTLANLESKALYKAFEKAHKILNKNGVFILQVLNFGKLIKGNKRIIKISSLPGEYIIRFYDILKRNLNFNIMRFKSANTNEYELNTTTLYPYSKTELLDRLQKAGFRKIKIYGSLNFDKFNLKSSNDLIIYSEK